MKGLVGVFTVAGLLLGSDLVLSGTAFAHGENSQEPWTRTMTATFFDLELDTNGEENLSKSTEVNIGERLTLTGKIKVMDAWPEVLGESDLAFLGILIPGPTLTLSERWINGAFVPGSFEVKPGDFFEFRLVLQSRRPGKWHLHPRVDFQGKGPVVGQGFWITIRDAGGPYSRPVKLLNGNTVDLERYGLGTVLVWHGIWIAVAAVWAAWWLRRSLYDRYLLIDRGASEERLVGRGDRRLTVVVGVLTFTILVGGVLYASGFETVPLQVHREPVPKGQEPLRLGEATMQVAEYDSSRHAMRVKLNVTNVTDVPITVGEFASSTLSFTNTVTGPPTMRPLRVQPDEPIAPGEQKQVVLVMVTPEWERFRLIPGGTPLFTMGGLVFFRGPAGRRSWDSVFADIVPDSLTH